MMGLIRYSKPYVDDPTGFAQGSVVGYTSPYSTDAWRVLDDNIGSYTRRTSGGGITTDVANDTDYWETGVGPSGGLKRHMLFAPIIGDDDLVKLRFHARARITVGGSVDLSISHRVSGSDYGCGGIAIPVTATSFTNYYIDASVDPVTGLPWSITTLRATPGQSFGLLSPGIADTNNLQVSRFYIEAFFSVGPTLGKDYREENWRYCDVCGLKSPYSRIMRPQAIHPQAGLSVCVRCYDQPDHDTLKAMSNSHPRDEQDTLY